MRLDKRTVGIALLVLACMGGLYALLDLVHPFGLTPDRVKDWMVAAFYNPVVKLIRQTLMSPAFYTVLLFTLMMEQFFPAEPKQNMFGVSFYQDLVWFFYETVLQAIVITSYVYWLTSIYNTHLSFLTIETVTGWPGWARFLIGVLLLDFLYWVQHYLNHKVPWFWQFHAVHHSQKELNFFTDYRYHIFEYVVRHTILVIPFLILKVDAPTIVAFSIFKRWYTRFYHGNIRTDLGPLRYFLVTPQSHRVHHSYSPEHRDLNFGALFSIWDFLFRTQYMGFHEYPKTGIPDDKFPLEKDTRLPRVIFMPLVQMAYPFRVIARQIKKAVNTRG